MTPLPLIARECEYRKDSKDGYGPVCDHPNGPYGQDTDICGPCVGDGPLCPVAAALAPATTEEI